MEACLLDTDITSYFLKGIPNVISHGNTYLAQHGQFQFSEITVFEVLSGLKAKQATKQLSQFRQFIRQHIIHPVTTEVLEQASDLYAHSVHLGMSIGPSDLIIAATALEHQLLLNTNNQKHFQHLPDLVLANWAK